MSLFPIPDSNGIPEINNFKLNPRKIDDAVKEAFLKSRTQGGDMNDDVVTRVRAIIKYLTDTCKTPTVDSSVKISCSQILNNYNTFLSNYTSATISGGNKRKTTKGRRKNKSRRNRKSRR